tara:strand:- start:554 stop:1162 length:609 start_codon:yes stop_codon:yes gene_type:complete
MDGTIYISRRCEHCHELLILLHQNRDSIRIPVIDVDTKQFPKIVKSVPCMVIEGKKILPGVELFKYINYLVEQISGGKSSSPSPPEKSQEMLPQQNNGMMVPGTMKNLNDPASDEPDMKPQGQGDLDLPGFCIGGSCDLGYSTLENEDDTRLDDNFEYLEGDETSKTCNIEQTQNPSTVSTKNEKSKQFDDDYSRMMQERRI